MAEINLATRHRFGYTNRKDVWWARPLAIFIGLSAFLIYVGLIFIFPNTSFSVSYEYFNCV